MFKFNIFLILEESPQAIGAVFASILQPEVFFISFFRAGMHKILLTILSLQKKIEKRENVYLRAGCKLLSCSPACGANLDACPPVGWGRQKGLCYCKGYEKIRPHQIFLALDLIALKFSGLLTIDLFEIWSSSA